jgi:hypothetical protein
VSIPVPLPELGAALREYPWGYLVTVRDDGRAHAVAVPVRFDGEVLRVVAGTSTRRHAAARPEVTFVLPPAQASGFSLIVDGLAAADGETILVRPSSAVRHQPAAPAETDATDVS